MEMISAQAADVIVNIAIKKTELEMLNDAFVRMRIIEDGQMEEEIDFLKNKFPASVEKWLKELGDHGY